MVAVAGPVAWLEERPGTSARRAARPVDHQASGNPRLAESPLAQAAGSREALVSWGPCRAPA
eukprot:6202141-Prymnesium_polylepis.3